MIARLFELAIQGFVVVVVGCIALAGVLLAIAAFFLGIQYLAQGHF